MPAITIYHNGRCGKSRKALEIIERSQLPFAVVLYLQNPPDVKTLQYLAARIDGGAQSMVRTKEPLYKELFGATLPNDETLLQALHKNPALLERPMVVVNERALLVRNDASTAALEKMLGLRP
jgi:arsenate reductase (glutaredoxin)